MTSTPPDAASTARLTRMARAHAFEAQQRDKLKATRAKDAYISSVMRQCGEPLPGSEAAARRRTRKFKADIRATRVVRLAVLLLG